MKHTAESPSQDSPQKTGKPRVVLVGTYKGDQLEKWRGWYCWPIADDDLKCCQCENVANGQSQLPMRSMGKLATGNNGNGNTSTLATLSAVTELWLFKGTAEQKTYCSALVIRCETDRALNALRVNSGAGFENVPVGPGSKVNTRYNIRIPAGEIDRLARIGRADNNVFIRYDDQAVEDFVNDPEGAPNPHSLSQIGNVLGDRKIQGAGLHCTTGFTLTLN